MNHVDYVEHNQVYARLLARENGGNMQDFTTPYRKCELLKGRLNGAVYIKIQQCGDCIGQSAEELNPKKISMHTVKVRTILELEQDIHVASM